MPVWIGMYIFTAIIFTTFWPVPSFPFCFRLILEEHDHNAINYQKWQNYFNFNHKKYSLEFKRLSQFTPVNIDILTAELIAELAAHKNCYSSQRTNGMAMVLELTKPSFRFL